MSNLDNKRLELVAVEIDEDDLNINFACCWGSFACFTSASCPGTTFTSGSTAACAC
ncbi:thiocillin family RiPP [Virgibacillus sp.]|uniref:thiocillin family RiPP n=1 Tax=Virgibacillus sp. TaxID=1872700 RepID=UPI00179AA0BA|nr:thiocillin family RiPP [Virgibacillus sp.]NWO15018.1 thiocillin family RiPP [Virgibacillus sp.]